MQNGIEYSLMQAYAEGFDIMRNRASEALPSGERFASQSVRYRRSLASWSPSGCWI
ncbi:hypothetical protein [Marinimicrobium agarilyticum]|uniref:hypothetical protein n=1 Tax=Marinimicrobium agarilyticum TaxID=306546 RepID=UPI001B7F8B60